MSRSQEISKLDVLAQILADAKPIAGGCYVINSDQMRRASDTLLESPDESSAAPDADVEGLAKIVHGMMDFDDTWEGALQQASLGDGTAWEGDHRDHIQKCRDIARFILTRERALWAVVDASQRLLDVESGKYTHADPDRARQQLVDALSVLPSRPAGGVD